MLHYFLSPTNKADGLEFLGNLLEVSDSQSSTCQNLSKDTLEFLQEDVLAPSFDCIVGCT